MCRKIQINKKIITSPSKLWGYPCEGIEGMDSHCSQKEKGEWCEPRAPSGEFGCARVKTFAITGASDSGSWRNVSINLRSNLNSPRPYLTTWSQSKPHLKLHRNSNWQNGEQCGRKAAEGYQVPCRIQSKGWHAEGEPGGYEEVRRILSRFHLLWWLTISYLDG